MKMKDLQKAKQLMEDKIKLNNTLLETIQAIKQDETNLQYENEIYKHIHKLIIRELRKKYKTGG